MEGEKTRKRKDKQQTKPQYKNLTAFKEMEKHFKLYANIPTDFSLVYQPAHYDIVDDYQVALLPYPQGAILVKKFNSPEIVYQVASQALNHFIHKPYRTNLDSREQLYKIQKQDEKKQLPPQKMYEEGQTGQKDMRQGYFFNDKIRWANVGLQYDWTERKYPRLNTNIPHIINQLCQRANKLFNTLFGKKKNYHPQSAIVNYYGEKDYMTGHLDDAQNDQISPIYSFSLGLSCIFLMGGPTKDIKPVPVRLDSGDLLMMAHESRKCYHGVPRIISNTYVPNQVVKTEIQQQALNKLQNIDNYLRCHRININVRQVFPTED